MLWYSIFSFLDYAVYSLVAFIVRLIMLIANYDFFSADVIKGIANKVYVVLGVVMMFKMVISAVQYMINPDVFDDKDKGMAGILKKMAICFILLVLVQPMFNFAIHMQESIVAAIPTIILGNGDSYEIKGNNDSASTRLNNIGNKVAATTIKAFVTLKSEVNNNGKTNDKDAEAIKKIKEKNYTNQIDENNLDSFAIHIKDGCENGILNGKAFTTESCYYDYRIGISTVAGIFLIYILASMAFDIGIRAIKLGILQILAPIPISSYVISKDKLSKFFKLALNVYIDLFIRMGVIYFIIFFVEKVINSITGNVVLRNGVQTTGIETAFIKIIIIIALFMFAKNAPKFISEVLGLNSDSGDLKDMFKPAWQRAGGLAAAGGMLTAGMGNAINKAKFTDWRNSTIGQKLKNAAKVAGSGVAGAASAGFHGGIAAMQGKDAKEVNAAGYKRAIKARQNRDLDKLNGINWQDRAKVRVGDMLGIDTKASLAESKQKAYSTLHQDVGNYKKAVMGRIVKNGNVSIRTDVKENGALHQLGRLMEENWDTIQRSGNADLIRYCDKFERISIEKKDASGNIVRDASGNPVMINTYKLKDGESFSYHDIAAVYADAVQTGIGSIAGLTGENGAITLLAQKELFTDAMKGTVHTTDRDSTGNYTLFDEINVNSGKAHTDITTAYQTAQQHLAENVVPLGESAEDLQAWFSGTAKEGTKHYKQDFNSMDDTYQRASAELSSKMSGSSEHLARASVERRNANKDKK